MKFFLAILLFFGIIIGLLKYASTDPELKNKVQTQINNFWGKDDGNNSIDTSSKNNASPKKNKAKILNEKRNTSINPCNNFSYIISEIEYSNLISDREFDKYSVYAKCNSGKHISFVKVIQKSTGYTDYYNNGNNYDSEFKAAKSECGCN